MYVTASRSGRRSSTTNRRPQCEDAGQKAKPAEPEKWQSLGVFAMVQGEETDGYNLFQLAVNKDGIIRGNYYNALTDSDEPVVRLGGQEDPASRLDGRRPEDAGLRGRDRQPDPDETTMLVHFGEDKTQQFTLVRIERPGEEETEIAN